MADALLRQWTLLKLIPRAPRTADVGQLLARLEDAGHTITRRQLQRDLNTLSTLFPITADDRGIPYGWSWIRGRTGVRPAADGRHHRTLGQAARAIHPAAAAADAQGSPAAVLPPGRHRTRRARDPTPRRLARPRARDPQQHAAARPLHRRHGRPHRLPGAARRHDASPPCTPHVPPSRANSW